MSTISKLLDITVLGNSVIGIALLKRFISRVVTIVVLAIFSSSMLAALIIACFYAAYLGFIYYGIPPFIAAVSMSIVALLATLLLIGLTFLRLQQLLNMRHVVAGAPIVGDMCELTDAFIKGFRHG